MTVSTLLRSMSVTTALRAVTDGEFRRSWWHFDYLAGLVGVEVAESEQGIQFHGVQTESQKIVVSGRVDFDRHYMLEHFRFLHAAAGVTAKMTIPSPSVLHEQFCLSPQCGFASTEEGNILSEDEQWRKVEMIVDLATEVWGG